MSGFDRRLRRLALGLGVCPSHAERLLCALCDFDEAPLPPAEDAELFGYCQRLGVRFAPQALHGRCPTCGEAARICLACEEVHGAKFDWSTLSPGARDRCLKLAERADLRRRAGAAGQPYGLSADEVIAKVTPLFARSRAEQRAVFAPFYDTLTPGEQAQVEAMLDTYQRLLGPSAYPRLTAPRPR